jgi:uncharacterized OB-fold protein
MTNNPKPPLAATRHLRNLENESITLVGTVCGECGFRVFPPVTICPSCLSNNVRETDLPRKGTLYSFTVTGAPSLGIAPPVIMGFVDLDDEIRVFAHIDAPLNKLSCDMPVELVASPQIVAHGGVSVVDFKFKSIEV